MAAIENFIHGIKTKSAFYNIAKHSNGALVKSENDVNPVAGFIDACKGEKVLVLSTLSRIREKSLDLKDYTINVGLAKALAHTFSRDRTILQRLVLENNNLSEKTLFTIMEGVSKQLCLKAFIYKRNDIGLESIDLILKSAKLRIPNNLSEVRIVNCKISSADTAALLEGLQTT